MTGKLLVIDDDDTSCRLVKAIFKPEGLEVETAHDGPTGLERIASDPPHAVLLDLRLPGLDGLEVLERLKTTEPALPVIMLTASRDIRSAVRATQLGAMDYLTKPINQDELVLVVRRALETRTLRLEVEDLRRQVGQDRSGGLVSQMGPSREIRRIIDQVALVADSNFTVLILGETGTGKELIAQAIHQQSDRRRKPFIALDCGAIPEPLLESELFGHERGAFTGAERRKQGRFQLAEAGTCFLDEVGNLPLTLQVKLLRVLESREVQPVGADRASPLNVRFVAATNHDLQKRVTQGLFRADLYFRLAQYTISVPPLRDRADDIAHLTQRFLDEARLELRRPIQTVLADAMELLRRHDWPGNVRELRNVIRQAVLQTKTLVIRSDVIADVMGHPAEGVPPPVAQVSGRSLKEIADQAAAAAEHQAIRDTLTATAGNKSQAARVLKTDFKTLHLKMKQLGIRARDFMT